MDQNKWLKHIEAYKASNLSKAAYARKHDLDYYQFIYWSGKIVKAQANFIPVKINSSVDNSSEDPVSCGCLGVMEFPNGIKLHIHSTALLSELSDYLPC